MYKGTPLKLDTVLIEERSREKKKHIHEFSTESSESLLRPDFSLYKKHEAGKIFLTVL